MVHVAKKRLEQLLSEVRLALAFDQPELTVLISGKLVVVEGLFAVQPTPATGHVVGGALGKYHIGIAFDGNFPESEPVVIELGKSIPQTPDYHINADGTSCIEIWEVWLTESEDHSVQAFLDGPLRNFFLGQLHKKEADTFPFEEHEHGNAGLVNAYADLLDCESDTDVIKSTLSALTQLQLRGHWQCPCGSGQRVRNCCRDQLYKLRQKIHPKRAKQMLQKMTQVK
jgi:hypothetical protein